MKNHQLNNSYTRVWSHHLHYLASKEEGIIISTERTHNEDHKTSARRRSGSALTDESLEVHQRPTGAHTGGVAV